MGGVNMEGGGGKRTLDFELNLVPFIDLLSCCISFLLITAVWTQMGQLETSQKLDGGGSTGEKPKKINITIAPNGYELTLPDDQKNCSVPRIGTEYDVARLKKVIEGQKNTITGQLFIGIAAVDELRFELLVDVMDVCAGLGLKNVSLGQLVAPPQGAAPCGGG